VINSEAKLDIIKASMAGKLETSAADAIRQAEQPQQAEESNEASTQQPTQPSGVPVGPPAGQTTPNLTKPKEEFVSPSNTSQIGLNQMRGSSRSGEIHPGQYKTGGPTDPPNKKKYNPMRTAMWDYLYETGRDTTNVNLLADMIGMHESTDDYSKDQIYNDGSAGEGRGRYQFEKRADAGGNTAATRLNNVITGPMNKGKIPDNRFWDLLPGATFNASHIQPGTQDALFVADKLWDEEVKDFNPLVGKVPFSNATPTSREMFEFWGKHHKRSLGKIAWKDATKEQVEKEWVKWQDRTKGVSFKPKKKFVGPRNEK